MQLSYRFFLSRILILAASGSFLMAQPMITSLSPSSAVAGGPGFTLTVNGSGFDSAAFVHWNGSNRPTTFMSTTTLLADISAFDILAAGTATVFVRNSPPTGPVSNTVNFSITSTAQNPVPVISQISPSVADAGGPAFTLTANGSGFISGSVVQWAGSNRQTTFVNSSQLRAAIQAADIATGGRTFNVTVFNPSPGGGTSGSLPFLVNAPAAAQLDVLPGSLTFQALAGGSSPPMQSLRIANTGGGSLNWTAQMSTNNGGNWLNLSRTSGTATSSSPSQVEVSAALGTLAASVYSGTITVRNSAGGSPITIDVFFKVLPATPVLRVGQTGLLFTGLQGDEATPPQNLTIVNAGQGTLNWVLQAVYSGTASNWLTLSSDRGFTSAGAQSTVGIRANPRNLAPGDYYAEIRVSASATNNSPQSVTVVLNILATGSTPAAQVSPLGLIFVATQGGAAPAAQNVMAASTVPGTTAIVTVSTTSGGNWLSADRNFEVTSDGTPIPVRAGPGGLQPGVYEGTVTVAVSDRTTHTVRVIFVVVAPAAPNAGELGLFRLGNAAPCVPTRVLAVTRLLGAGFASPVGWPRVIEVQAVDDCGNPANNATVLATFSTGDAPLVLTGLGNGIYSGTWKPSSPATQATVTIRVNLAPLTEAVVQIQGSVSSNASVPVVGSGGVVNGASFAKGQPMAPGSIVSLFGTAMAGTTPGGAADLPLPTTLAGASVVIGGITVPLFFSSAGQINAQVPVELSPNTQPQVVVRLSLTGNNAISVPETIALDAARPGIFIANAQGQGVAIDVQGRVADAAAPAAAGEVLVVYTTGLGATSPAAVTGRASPSNPPGVAVVQPAATIGGVNAPVQFAGLTPGFVGLYQVNIQVPSGVTPGAAVPLVITQNGNASNTVTIGVR